MADLVRWRRGRPIDRSDIADGIRPGQLGLDAFATFYRIRSNGQAARYPTELTDRLALNPISELQELRRALVKWNAGATRESEVRYPASVTK